MRKPINLFVSKMHEAKLHSAFRALRDSEIHAEARGLMNGLYARMGDPNGNFPSDFQTEGFHSRLFELACFAYLETADFNINRLHQSPDFLASARNGVTVAIESTTANPPTGRGADISVLQMPDLSEAEIFEKVENEFPRRMASVLQKKLAYQYHHLSHCRGKPLVLMVAPFFEPGAVFYTDESLLKCLYGVGAMSTDSTIPFFDLPDAISVSGVLYCNAFTVPRFFRMATRHKNTKEVVAIRTGVCYTGDPHEDNAPHEFQFRVGDPSAPKETWPEGVTLFLNPNASHPLPSDTLPRTCTFSVLNNVVTRNVHGFHPVTSFMLVSVPDTETKAT